LVSIIDRITAPAKPARTVAEIAVEMRDKLAATVRDGYGNPLIVEFNAALAKGGAK